MCMRTPQIDLEKLQTNLKIASKSLKIAQNDPHTNHLLGYAAKHCVNPTFCVCEHHIPCVNTCYVNTTENCV
jgi:hypothetical protein